MIDKNTFRIVSIGAGRLATHLMKALHQAGFRIVQVYSRTEKSASELARCVDAQYTLSLDEIEANANLYISSVSDAALESLAGQITTGRHQGIFVHTAGSIPMAIWEGHARHYGVFYPMQTFSKERAVDFAHIPFFLEANEAAVMEILQEIACALSDNVRELSSEKRRTLHLAAVFACNFTNHMYALAEKLLAKEGIPFDVMLPLTDETAAKVHELSPRDAQTGPAVRYDENVINKHLQLLADEPGIGEVYEKISKSIYLIENYLKR